MLLNNILLTKDNLIRRGVIEPNTLNGLGGYGKKRELLTSIL